MRIRLKVLKKTKAFYKWLLEEKEMTEKQENAIIKAEEKLGRIIKKREKSGENKNDYKGDIVFKN